MCLLNIWFVSSNIIYISIYSSLYVRKPSDEYETYKSSPSKWSEFLFLDNLLLLFFWCQSIHFKKVRELSSYLCYSSGTMLRFLPMTPKRKISSIRSLACTLYQFWSDWFKKSSKLSKISHKNNHDIFSTDLRLLQRTEMHIGINTFND